MGGIPEKQDAIRFLQVQLAAYRRELARLQAMRLSNGLRRDVAVQHLTAMIEDASTTLSRIQSARR